MTSVGSNDITATDPPVAQYGSGADRKRHVAVKPALEFEHKRRPPGDEIDKIAERQHALRGRLVGDALQGHHARSAMNCHR
jgi:hypothetical protein